MSSNENSRASLRCGKTCKPTLICSFFFSNSIIILLLPQHFSKPSDTPCICNGKHYPQQKCAALGGKIGEGATRECRSVSFRTATDDHGSTCE